MAALCLAFANIHFFQHCTFTDHNTYAYDYSDDHLGPPEQGGILFLVGLPHYGAEPGAPSLAPCWQYSFHLNGKFPTWLSSILQTLLPEVFKAGHRS